VADSNILTGEATTRQSATGVVAAAAALVVAFSGTGAVAPGGPASNILTGTATTSSGLPGTGAHAASLSVAQAGVGGFAVGMENTGSGVDWPVTLQVTQTGSGTAESNQPSNILTGTAATLGGITGTGAHSAAFAVSQTGVGGFVGGVENTGSGQDFPVSLVVTHTGTGTVEAAPQPSNILTGTATTAEGPVGTGSHTATLAVAQAGTGLVDPLLPADGTGAHSAALTASQTGTGTVINTASGTGAHSATLAAAFTGSGLAVNPDQVTGTGAHSAALSTAFSGTGRWVQPFDLGVVRYAPMSDAPPRIEWSILG